MRPELLPLRRRLRLPFWHRDDIEAEIGSHLDETEAELCAQGRGEAEARRIALERLGNLDAVGESLQAVHHGWTGGATVRRRFAKVLLAAAAMCVVVGVWLFAVISVIHPDEWVDNTTRQSTTALERAAAWNPDPSAFWGALWDWHREHPLVTWMGIVDSNGKLAYSHPLLGWDSEPLPEAEWFLTKFDESGKRVAPTVTSEWPLRNKLASAGIPVTTFHSITLGGSRSESYRGTAIIALARPLWGEQVLHAMGKIEFWCGVIWLLSALAILLHHRPCDPFGAWIWGLFALLLGPIAWVVYLLLIGLRQIPRPEAPQVRRLILVPLVTVALTACLLLWSFPPVPVSALDLYAFRPERGAEHLARSRRGVRILLRAANSRQYLTRRAAVEQLERVLDSWGAHAAAPLPTWARMLNSEHPLTRRLGLAGVEQVSAFRAGCVDANQLFEAWKIALGSDHPDVRQSAWVPFVHALARRDAFPYRFAHKIPKLLALRKDEPAVDDLLLQSLWYRPIIHNVGLVVIGTEQRVSVKVQPSEAYGYLRGIGLHATATSDHVGSLTPSQAADAEATVQLGFAYAARGPEGLHREWIKLLSKQGALMGVIELRAQEITEDKLRRLRDPALAWQAASCVLGPVVIGSDHRVRVSIEARKTRARTPKVAGARPASDRIHSLSVETTSPSEARVELVYSARGPAGPRLETIELLSERGDVVGLVAVWASEERRADIPRLFRALRTADRDSP